MKLGTEKMEVLLAGNELSGITNFVGGVVLFFKADTQNLGLSCS